MRLKIRNRIPIWVLILLSVLLMLFLFLLVSFLIQDTSLKLVSEFELPELNNVSALSSLGYDNYAVSVDGVLVAGSNLSTPAVRPTASTAKIILGLAIMKAKPFALGEKGETLTINEDDYYRYIWYINNGGSNTAVVVGEEISEYDALVSIFLASSNNMADSLAVWAFGSLENYREYATKMLQEWGIVDTTIGEDASGFSETTTSTANDLARIGQKVLENQVLAEIVGTASYELPVAGVVYNTNKLLGESGISGIKTGFIGNASGYCLVSGYYYDSHVITVSLLGAPSRDESFDDSLAIVNTAQNVLKNVVLAKKGDVVGYYDAWWTGKVPIVATATVDGLGWNGAEAQKELKMDGKSGILKIWLGGKGYEIPVEALPYNPEPSFGERLSHAFGWSNNNEVTIEEDNKEVSEEVKNEESEEAEIVDEAAEGPKDEEPDAPVVYEPISSVPSDNCTIKYGYLMLINPNFTVDIEFIDSRRNELISLYDNYGIVEGNPYNGDNLLDAEAASHLNEMNNAYSAEYPGHAFETRSCYRARGTTCGRLCAATGTSDHHTGLTCDLLDPDYGTSLDTDTYDQHIDWQWLYANSYKYGFIDRFPEAWAGGPMSEPLNVDEYGSTGLFETWHYRYVGVEAATEIATGKYNNGEYDSLEHYLKARGLVVDLKNGLCE